MSVTVLVVDDDPYVREAVSLILEAEGYRVLEASGGEAGIALATRARPDVVLVDLRMPATDGYEVAARLRREPGTASIPLVAFSAELGREERPPGLRARGFAGGLAKPCTRDALLAAVRSLTAGG